MLGQGIANANIGAGHAILHMENHESGELWSSRQSPLGGIRGLHFYHRKIEHRNVFVTNDVSAVTLVGAGSALHARFDIGNSRDTVTT